MREQPTNFAPISAGDHPDIEGFSFGRTLNVSNVPENFIARRQNRTIEFQASFLNTPAMVSGPVLEYGEINKNNWAVDESDFPELLSQINSGQVSLRLDHADEVSKIIGLVKGGRRSGNTVFITAELGDGDTFEKLRRGYLAKCGFSLRGTAEDVLCAKCRRSTRPIKTCTCKMGEIIKGLKLKEISIVSAPAFRKCEGGLTLT